MELSAHTITFCRLQLCAAVRNEGVREGEEKINEQKVIDGRSCAAPLDIRFRGNVLTKLSRGLVRRLADVRRIDLGDGRGERKREE